MKHIPDADINGLDTIEEGYIPPFTEGDERGVISIDSLRNFVAGSHITIRFIYTVGTKGIAEGGVLRIGTPCTGWEKPLLLYSRYWYKNQPASYIRANTSIELKTTGKATLRNFVEARMLRYAPPGGMWRWWISSQVQDGSLFEGDSIEIIYGDTSWGEEGVQVQKFLERGAYFMALVDVDGDGHYFEIPNSPFVFDVVAGPAQRVHITMPSLAQTGQKCKMRFSLTDEYWNPTRVESVMQFELQEKDESSEMSGLPSEIIFADEQPWEKEIQFALPGKKQVKALMNEGASEGESNPVWVQSGKIDEQIYWGDLHAQSQYHGPGASSVGTPDELYYYAREIMHLDFAAITDDVAPLSEGWNEIQQAAIDNHEPGIFIPFKAFEWCSKRYGHRNTIYADALVEDHYPRTLFEGGISEFWEFFRNKNVLIIPHHTFLWTKWDYHDPELEPLVEIHSCWGTSEKPGNPNWDHSIIPGGGVQAGLKRGYRIGIIASSDTCTGMPGRSLPNAERWNFHKEKGGLAAVYASDLTRESIFNALKNRRTYGTTGARIILNFEINTYPMGSEFSYSGNEPLQVLIKAVGTDLIRSVTIVRNNQDIHTFNARDDIVDFTYTEKQDLSTVAFRDEQGDPICFYYVRVTQYDGEVAWSSPIWIKLTV